MRDFTVIKCPKCGYEYLPEEIFFADTFLGTGKNVVRDSKGKIICFDGDTMNTSEEFTCDNCGCTFDVVGRVSFTSCVDLFHDFSEDYSISLNDESNKNQAKDLWTDDNN